jgi:sortase A
VAVAAHVEAPLGPVQPGHAAGGPGEAPARRSAPVARRQPMPSAAITVAWTLTSLSALAVWLILYGFSLSGLQEHSAQHAVYATLRSELAQATAPLGGNIKTGTAVAILRVPQAGVDDVVLEGTTAGVLEQGPGLEADTPLPGQAGVSVILGRQAMFGAPFRHLNALRRGDLMQVTTGQGTFDFRVNDVRYPGDPLPGPLAPGRGRMTLVTTTGSGWRGVGTSDQFMYVDTSLIGQSVASPPGRPNALPANQQPMHGDTSVLMPLVLWMQLLLLLVILLVWVRSRWGSWQTWLVGAPALLAVLWVVSEVSFQLLPNLI